MDLRVWLLVALGWCLSLGIMGGGSYYYGHKNALNEVAADQLKLVAAAAEAGRIATKTEGDIALAEQTKRSAMKLAARSRQHALELELTKDESIRNCRISDAAFRVLSDAVDSANGAKANTGK